MDLHIIIDTPCWPDSSICRGTNDNLLNEGFDNFMNNVCHLSVK